MDEHQNCVCFNRSFRLMTLEKPSVAVKPPAYTAPLSVNEDGVFQKQSQPLTIADESKSYYRSQQHRLFSHHMYPLPPPNRPDHGSPPLSLQKTSSEDNGTDDDSFDVSLPSSVGFASSNHVENNDNDDLVSDI